MQGCQLFWCKNRTGRLLLKGFYWPGRLLIVCDVTMWRHHIRCTIMANIMQSDFREIPRSRSWYSHATTQQDLRARKLVRHTRYALAYKGTRETWFDDHGFSGFRRKSTTPDHTTPAYSNFSFQMQQRKFPRPYLRNDTMYFHGNLDKCLSKMKSRLATPALWLSSPHWAKCMTNTYPRRSPSK